MRAERFERHAPVRLFPGFRNFLHGIPGTFRTEDVFPVRVGKVINFLGLPGAQVIEKRLEAAYGGGELLSKRGGIARKVESFGGQDTARLMVAMIFANERTGQEGEDHLRAREPDDAYELLEHRAVSPVGERLQNILRGVVMSAHEPYVRDAHRIDAPPRFDFPSAP